MQERRRLSRSMPMRIAAWQILIGLVGALVWGVLSGLHDALAAMAGGAVGAILTLTFALYAFRRRANLDPRAALFSLFQGAAIKLALAVIVFVLAAQLIPAHYPALLSTFILGLTGYWLALLWLRPGDR